MTATAPPRTGALAWRLARQGLHEPSEADAVAVVRRMLAVRAWPGTIATTATRMRSTTAPDVQEAVARRDLVVVYAFGGGSYVATPRVAALLHAARLVTGIWRTDRWQRQGDFALDDWEPLRTAVRERVADGPATRAEIAAALEGVPGLRHLATAAREGSGADSLYKPLHWFGDLRFGPARDGRTTFALHEPEPRAIEDLDLDDAGRRLVALALASFAPLTIANLERWIGEGLGVPRRRLADWVADLGDDVARIAVLGADAMCIAEDRDAILGSERSGEAHLVPGYDPWITVPGTSDASIVAEHRRALATRGANLVLHGGVVGGTWRRDGRSLAVTWFDEAGAVPDLEAAVARLAAAVDRDLAVTVGRD